MTEEGLATSDHYNRVMKSLDDAHRTWALVLHALVIAAVWPRWESVASVPGCMAVLTPLNILSGGASSHAMEQATSLADEYLLKPIAGEDLLHAIERVTLARAS